MSNDDEQVGRKRWPVRLRTTRPASVAEWLEPRRLLAATITVNSSGDSNARDAAITLREALLISNRSLAVASLSAAEKALVVGTPTISDADTIAFNLPASDPGHVYYRDDGLAGQVSVAKAVVTTAATDAGLSNADPDWAHGWFSITPTAPLPEITEPVTIDGYTQPGAAVNTLAAGQGLNSVLRIEISGQGAGDLVFGLFRLRTLPTAGASALRGLVLNRVQGPKILLEDENGSNVIAGNYIGPDVSGSIAFPPPQSGGAIGFDGVRVRASRSNGNLIGGLSPADRNLLSGNAGGSGVFFSPSSGNQILGNLVGTDRSGNRALGNGVRGLTISFDDVVGGDAAGAANIVSGNPVGVFVGGLNAVVMGNRIGVGASGGALGNVGAGVDFNPNASGARIVQNVVANNGAGVVLGFLVGNRNLISQNSIFNNGGVGIDLGVAGVTANDPAPDADTGPNALQNSPVITSVERGNLARVAGALAGSPSGSYRIEFFANADRDVDSLSPLNNVVPGQYGEGEAYVGGVDVVADANGLVNFSVDIPSLPAGKPFITATATDITIESGAPRNNTSEFSNVVPLGGPSFTVINTGDSGLNTLREAIINANLTPGVQTIRFALPGGDARHFYYRDDGVAGAVSTANIARGAVTSDSSLSDIDPDWPHSWWSIKPTRTLPAILDTVVVDGYTQKGAGPNTLPALGPLDTVLRVELDGSGVLASGLSVTLGVNTGGGDPTGGSGSTIRGLAVNRFGGDGITLGSFGGVTVAGNFIGTDVSGTVGLGNGGNGIQIVVEDNTTVGGPDVASRNLISSNIRRGIDIAAGSGQRIEGNLIGWDRRLVAPLSNLREAVRVRSEDLEDFLAAIDAPSPRGRLAPSAGSAGAASLRSAHIAVNNILKLLQPQPEPLSTPPLVTVADSPWPSLKAPPLVLTNNQFDEAFNGTEPFKFVFDPLFDLGPAGVTPNDPDDTDTGPNDLQNFPSLLPFLPSFFAAKGIASAGAATTSVAGTLNSTPNSSFRIEVYERLESVDRVQVTPLGFANVTTDAAGDASFTFTADRAVPAGEFLVATATLLETGTLEPIATSEFSAPLPVGGETPPVVAAALASSSDWTPAFLGALGSAGLGDQGFSFLSSSAQMTPLSWNRVDRFTFRFAAAPAVSVSDLQVKGVRTPQYAVSGFSYDPATFTAAWTLAVPITATDRLTLSLKGLDFKLKVVPGDVDHNGSVNALDLVRVRNRVGRSASQPGSGATAYDPFTDLNGDGVVNAADLVAVRNRIGGVLPAAPSISSLFAERRIAPRHKVRDEAVAAQVELSTF